MAYQRARTETERLADVMLSLVVMHLASEHGFVGDRLKCMKLLFLSEYGLYEKNIKALSMTFHRDKYGPMSTQAYEAWASLSTAGMAFEPETGDDQFEVLEAGHELAAAFMSDVLAVGTNCHIADVLVGVAGEFAGTQRSALLDMVYDMHVPTLENPRSRRKIRSVPQGETFTAPMDDDSAAVVIDIPDEWVCSLSLEFNEANRALLSRAMDDMRSGRAQTV